MSALVVQGQFEEVIITKEMAEMERNLKEEGERKEREMMEKVMYLIVHLIINCVLLTSNIELNC